MKANNIVNNNVKVKVTLTFDNHRRLAALVQLLATIDKRNSQPRDERGRFASPKPKQKKKGKIEAKARQKAGLF